jgi:hypothetical protein
MTKDDKYFKLYTRVKTTGKIADVLGIITALMFIADVLLPKGEYPVLTSVLVWTILLYWLVRDLATSFLQRLFVNLVEDETPVVEEVKEDERTKA